MKQIEFDAMCISLKRNSLNEKQSACELYKNTPILLNKKLGKINAKTKQIIAELRKSVIIEKGKNHNRYDAFQFFRYIKPLVQQFTGHYAYYDFTQSSITFDANEDEVIVTIKAKRDDDLPF